MIRKEIENKSEKIQQIDSRKETIINQLTDLNRTVYKEKEYLKKELNQLKSEKLDLEQNLNDLKDTLKSTENESQSNFKLNLKVNIKNIN